MTPDMVFQDPYCLDFLGLTGAYSEKDLEQAVLREMEAVIPALGAGFAFVERQKRIHVGADDFYLDLLFYNRKLRWLDKHERADGEEAPIGLILCSE